MPDRSQQTEGSIGYLTSQYPATSHTFISREIEGVRELGVPVETFSVKPPFPSQMKDDVLRAESHRTFTIFRQPVSAFIVAQLTTLFRAPAGYFGMIGTAIRHRPPGARSFFMAFAYAAEAMVLARELKRRRVSRLHSHFANPGALVGMLAAKLLNLPWSFTMHGISETDYPSGLVLAKKIRAAEFVACVSYFGRAQAMRLVEPEQWHKLHIVHCGLPLDRMPPRANGGSSTRLICVGRLSPEKGQAGLLKAFAAVSRQVSALELFFVGEGPDEEELQVTTRELGIAERVTFAGRRGESETLNLIAQSDILVLPSFMEGLPIVLMEAMAIGTPVIASRVAGIPELVVDGENGLLFTPSNWDELANCMRRLASDRDLQRSLAKAGQAAVQEEFDIRLTARKMVALFAGNHA